MNFKQAILVFLTLVAALVISSSLLSSLQEPQVQNRLDLYQTNIVLKASEWERLRSEDGDDSLFSALFAGKSVDEAIQTYREARDTSRVNINKILTEIPALSADGNQKSAGAVRRLVRQLEVVRQLEKSLREQRDFLAEVDLNLGILEARQGNLESAQKIWRELAEETGVRSDLAKTARVLGGLWSQPALLLPDSAELIQANLQGWFRNTALSQLYQVQELSEALTQLQQQIQETAEDAVTKLFLVGITPYIMGLVGLGLIVFLLFQRLRQGKEALLARYGDTPWPTPWDGYTILEVLVVGFFLVGQFVAPLLVSAILQFFHLGNDVRSQAIRVFSSYLLVAFAAIAILWNAIRSYFPLESDWFRFRFRSNWILWGVGGYCVAIPIVLIISLLNQQFWQGKGGSNPLLQLVLEGKDTLALSLFFSTAAIAAPLFEELLFRGFLLPSLTRYMSVWGAIGLSSLIFAAAHLSISELLPLFSLGMILGIVYTRSRNLLAPMLVHALWNTGTMLTLLVLGSE